MFDADGTIMLMLEYQPVWPAFMKRVLDAGAGFGASLDRDHADEDTGPQPTFFATGPASQGHPATHDLESHLGG